MHDELKELFLREDVLDTVNYLIVNEKIDNINRENYCLTCIHFDKDLYSCQIDCQISIYFLNQKTANLFLELMDFLELQVGLIQKTKFSWFPNEPVFMGDNNNIVHHSDSTTMFFQFTMLDRDIYNYPL